jgi:hypothetical protein
MSGKKTLPGRPVLKADSDSPSIADIADAHAAISAVIATSSATGIVTSTVCRIASISIAATNYDRIGVVGVAVGTTVAAAAIAAVVDNAHPG